MWRLFWKVRMFTLILLFVRSNHLPSTRSQSLSAVVSPSRHPSLELVVPSTNHSCGSSHSSHPSWLQPSVVHPTPPHSMNAKHALNLLNDSPIMPWLPPSTFEITLSLVQRIISNHTVNIAWVQSHPVTLPCLTHFLFHNLLQMFRTVSHRSHRDNHLIANMIVHQHDRLTTMIVESSTHAWVVSMAVIASISMNRSWQVIMPSVFEKGKDTKAKVRTRARVRRTSWHWGRVDDNNTTTQNTQTHSSDNQW